MSFIFFAMPFLLIPMVGALLAGWMTPRAWTSVLLLIAACLALIVYNLDWRGRGERACAFE